MSFTLTPVLRPMETGSLEVAALYIPPIFIIPPHQKSYVQSAACTADCTKDLNSTGITIYGGMAFVHSAVTGVKLRHLKGNEELPPLFDLDMKNRANHLPIALDKERHFQPEDVLILECTYNTENREEPTFGGPLSSKQEYCTMTLWYYPKAKGDIFACFANPNARFYGHGLNLRHVKSHIDIVNPFVKYWATGKNSTGQEVKLVDAAKDFKWTVANTDKFVDTVSKATYMAGCVSPKIKEEKTVGLNIAVDMDLIWPPKSTTKAPINRYCCPRHHHWCPHHHRWCWH